MPEAGTAGACAIRGGAALSPIALASRRAFQVRLRCRACGAQMIDSTECSACGVASPAHTAVRDRAKRVRHRATHSEARHLLGDDKRRLGARVSAAQDYHVCDQAEELLLLCSTASSGSRMPSLEPIPPFSNCAILLVFVAQSTSHRFKSYVGF